MLSRHRRLAAFPVMLMAIGCFRTISAAKSLLEHTAY